MFFWTAKRLIQHLKCSKESTLYQQYGRVLSMLWALVQSYFDLIYWTIHTSFCHILNSCAGFCLWCPHHIGSFMTTTDERWEMRVWREVFVPLTCPFSLECERIFCRTVAWLRSLCSIHEQNSCKHKLWQTVIHVLRMARTRYWVIWSFRDKCPTRYHAGNCSCC